MHWINGLNAEKECLDAGDVVWHYLATRGMEITVNSAALWRDALMIFDGNSVEDFFLGSSWISLRFLRLLSHWALWLAPKLSTKSQIC